MSEPTVHEVRVLMIGHFWWRREGLCCVPALIRVLHRSVHTADTPGFDTDHRANDALNGIAVGLIDTGCVTQAAA